MEVYSYSSHISTSSKLSPEDKNINDVTTPFPGIKKPPDQNPATLP